MSADSSNVRELMAERRSAEKEIERLRAAASQIAQDLAGAARTLHDSPERLALPSDTEPLFDGAATIAAELAGTDRVQEVVRDLRTAILRERAARLHLRELGVDLEQIEDELLSAKSRALRRSSRIALPADDKPKRQPIGFDRRKGEKPKQLA